MANHNRKTRKTKVETVRIRFTSAVDAKAVEERLNAKAGTEVERRGRTITIPETSFKALARAADAENAAGTEVGSRGRPKRGEEAPTLRTVGPQKAARTKKSTKVEKVPSKTTSGKSTRQLIEPLPEEARIGMKKRKYVVLCPAATDAKKLAKATGGKPDGARVTLMAYSAEEAAKKARRAAKALEFPIILESGFENLKPAKKKTEIESGTVRRPKSKSVKRPAEADKGKSGKSKPVVSMVVVSSTITKVWYNMQTLNLTVEFKNGSKYRYADVSLKEFKALVCADSQGKHFAEHIKDVKETTKLKAE